MTVEEFVAEINSKCENVHASLSDYGLVVRSKNGKAAVCLFFHVRHIGFTPVYGVMMGSSRQYRYLDEKGRKKIIDRLKKAIGYQDDKNEE